MRINVMETSSVTVMWTELTQLYSRQILAEVHLMTPALLVSEWIGVVISL